MRRSQAPLQAQIEVILGALLFGASIPAGKILLRGLPPMAVSGGLYLSAGLFCALLLLASPKRGFGGQVEGREWWWLVGAIALGGVLGPIALFYGLRETAGSLAGLLLHFEVVFTAGIAALIFGDRVGKRGLVGSGLVIAGAVALSGSGPAGTGATRPLGALLVIAACACWALDNNFAQRVSLKDARQIVAFKGLVGGVVSLGLAGGLGQLGAWSWGSFVAVFLVGALSYGVSIALFIRGLRRLGVIRTSTLFALAPGFAAVLSWVFLREPPEPLAWLALAGMTTGAVLLATDVHAHIHAHDALEHAHVHEHDEHHQHEHEPEDLARVPHTHRHVHPRTVHTHAHAHEAHHQHGH